MNRKNKRTLIELLSAFVTEQRLEKMHQVLSRRTRHLCLVLEDIYQSHNASAVIRSCDCFGIQDVHIIENKNVYNVNPDVALGATKWLSLHKYDRQEFNTIDCILALKKKGYRIVATSPHKGECLLEELPVDNKLALMFGTELKGLTDEAVSMADAFVKIPMEGFTESFNISVSAAICLYHLTPKIRSNVSHWQLSTEEKEDILLDWLMQSVNRSDSLIRQYIESGGENG
ncbi:MAG: RNA methyltransferase [Bacteroidales bacterium]|nr:RNA methyltransferase [Bacteroidales bacterium]